MMTISEMSDYEATRILTEIDHGVNLDEYLYHPEAFIRAAVAAQGHRLDVLMEDSDPQVISSVFDAGIDFPVPDHWLNDQPEVMLQVLAHGRYLEWGLESEWDKARMMVSNQEYGLDELLDDEDRRVSLNAKWRLGLLDPRRVWDDFFS